MIGMVLPQGMWAGVNIDTSTPGKVIVTSENAGDFATYLNNANADQLNALKVNEIVFVGNFNESDLSTLKEKNCATQKKVDMAEAKFIKSASASTVNTWLFHSENDMQSKQEGDHCLVGAEKYISAPSRSWVSIDENDIPANTNVVLKSESEFASYVNNNYEEYIKVPATFRYYKMVVTYDNNNPIKTWKLVEDESTIPSNATIKDADFEESNLNNRTDFCNDGEYIRFGATFNYYTNPVTLGWVNATGTSNDYNNGDNSTNHYQNIGDAPAPTDQGQMVMIGGTEYIYTSGQWVLASQGGGSAEYDYTQMKFDYWGNNVEEIITSNYATGAMAQQLCNNCSNLKTLTLSAGDFTGSVLGNKITHLETVNIQNQVTALGKSMFNQAGKEGNIQHLTTVTFQDGCQIKTLPESVFAETGVTSISIPSSVELIETNAFQACQSLETVTFVNTNKKPLVIKNKAFQQSDHIKDIYLNVNPKDRLLICEYNAFDYHSMEGQTAEGSEMATLHFAEENFDYYAGEWKKGMAFSQSELNAFKDGIEIKDDQENVIYVKPNTQDPTAWSPNGYAAIESYGDRVDGYYHDTNNWNTKYAPANGWQQFAKTASDREIEITGNVYMTYSTDTPYSLPKGIVAFRVTDYKYAVKNAKGYDTNGTLILKAINQVPTETGMLLISTSDYVIKTSDVNANPNVQSVFYFGDPDGEPAKYNYTMGEAGDPTSNYLAPAVHGIAVGPVSQDNPDAKTGAINVNGRPFTHRNFAMHKTSHQFVRLTHCTMPDNRAFLSLPITKFDNPDEGPEEGPTPTQTLAGKDISLYDGYDHPYTTEAGAKASLVFDYDVEQYGMIWPLIKDDSLTGVTTGIKNVNVETVQEGIYTLQGVKVSAPSTKGIYIVNGKKVIIK